LHGDFLGARLLLFDDGTDLGRREALEQRADICEWQMPGNQEADQLQSVQVLLRIRGALATGTGAGQETLGNVEAYRADGNTRTRRQFIDSQQWWIV
jgi:hypothetical protein